MIRGPLRYHCPDTVEEAGGLLAAGGGAASVLAGGTTLLPRMFRGETSPLHVVDLKALDLGFVSTDDPDSVTIGAMATYDAIAGHSGLAAAMPLLRAVSRTVTGGRQLTRQATFVGAVCNNFPTSDAPGVAAATNAVVNLHGPDGRRRSAMKDFLVGDGRVDLRPGEFAVSLTLPRHPGFGYCKIKHSAGSWPIVTSTAVLWHEGAGVRVSVGAASAVPIVVEFPSLEAAADASQVREAVSVFREAFRADVLADENYRERVAPVAVARAVRDLMSRERP